MRRICFFVLLLLQSACPILANDFPIIHTSEGINYGSEERIRLEEEHVHLQLFSYHTLDSLHFRADYAITLIFNNTTDDRITVKTLFPCESYENEKIVNYTTFVNQVAIPTFERQDVQIEDDRYDYGFAADISFDAGSRTVVKHTYSLISAEDSLVSAEWTNSIGLGYILQTGRNWSADSVDCTILVDMDDFMLYHLWYFEPAPLTRFSRNRLQWHLDELPEENLYLEFLEYRDPFSDKFEAVYPEDKLYLFMDEKEIKLSTDNKFEEENLLFENLDFRDRLNRFNNVVWALDPMDLSADEVSKVFRPDDELETILGDSFLLYNAHVPYNLKDFLLYYLSQRNLEKDPDKAIQLMERSALFKMYDHSNPLNLQKLSEFLIEQRYFTKAKKILHKLVEQESWPGLSIYAQLTLKERGWLAGPLDLELPRGKSHFRNRVNPLSKWQTID